MATQQVLNFKRVEKAIEYITANFKEQPTLDDVARHVGLSPFHFQRLFNEWVGISPKKFLQYTTLEHAKSLLHESRATLFETACETGLSGTGRLHDLFITIEGMTPAEFKNGGKNLTINYSFAESMFGEILVASTSKGVCFLGFSNDHRESFSSLLKTLPNANFIPKVDALQQKALSIFTHDWKNLDKIKLHLNGTEFQIKVWQALLKIPMGLLTTYGQIAKDVENPNASRAVGTAIGSNPVAFLIPCHRVILSSGKTGGYMWGSSRKAAIIGWESVITAGENI